LKAKTNVFTLQKAIILNFIPTLILGAIR